MLSVFIFFAILLGLFYFFNLRKSLPPGPIPLPVLGNLPQLALGAIQHKSFLGIIKQYKEQYGNVFTFWLGPLPTVMIGDYDTAYDAFVSHGDPHTDRHQIYILNFFRQNRGIVMSEGEAWQEHRRFVLHTLRNFGLGRNIMEERIREEIDYAFEVIDAKIAKSADGKTCIRPVDTFDVLVGSVINRMILGFRFEPARQDEFFTLKHRLDRVLETNTPFDMAMNKWMSKLPGVKQRFDKIQFAIGSIVDFIKKNIDERKAAIASGKHQLSDEGDDLMDAYFIEMNRRREKGDMGTFSEAQLEMCILDLWIAGMETTINTLCWGFSFLLLHPDEITKCQREIDAVTGGNRPVSLTDRPQMPYFNATVQEIQRLASIITINVWRKCRQTSQVGGYTIREGTVLAAVLGLLLSDERTFDSPKEFRPSRFVGHKELEARNVPFGLGKRSCLGESLARAELFLILGALLQKYDFEIDPKAPPSIKPFSSFSFFNRPCNFNLIMKKRSNY